jgi:hypothetical protein
MEVFNAKTVLNDGNCLFLSLAMLVKNDETLYNVLRRKVLIHVRDNGNNFEGPRRFVWRSCRSSKAVPLHAIEALRGRGGIAPTHSRPRHYMGVSGQHHAPAALYPRGKDAGTHCTGGWVGPRTGLDTEARGKILCPCRGSNVKLDPLLLV